MNTITVILVGVALIIALGAVIFALIKDRKSLKTEIKRLNGALESAKENVTQLVDYIERVQKIKVAEKTTADKIKEAKTDEEVYDIVASIIQSNNSKLQDN